MPLKTSENLWFYDVFRGYRIGTLAGSSWINVIFVPWNTCNIIWHHILLIWKKDCYWKFSQRSWKKNAYRDSMISDDIFFSCTTWTCLESLKIITELLTCKFLMSNLTFRWKYQRGGKNCDKHDKVSSWFKYCWVK